MVVSCVVFMSEPDIDVSVLSAARANAQLAIKETERIAMSFFMNESPSQNWFFRIPEGEAIRMPSTGDLKAALIATRYFDCSHDVRSNCRKELVTSWTMCDLRQVT